MSVPALCCNKTEFEPLGRGCTVAEVPEDMGCDHKRRWMRVARVTDVPGGFLPFAHHDCIHNQIAALRNRVLGATPQPTAEGLAALHKQRRRITRVMPNVMPQELYDMPYSYGGAKRNRYIRAADQLLEEGLKRKDGDVEMFVKFEKLNSVAKSNPDPRAIQFRKPKYCVAVAQYLKPIEHLVYQMRGDGTYLPGSRVIGKGLSQVERAKLLKFKLGGFVNPRVLSLDASRFDKHVSDKLLEVEHAFYLDLCPNDEFRRLLSWQLVNHGKTTRGIRYVARGRRMSGDMNTALGNCILMILMVSAFMDGKKYDILDDGDDCLLIVEEELLQWVRDHIFDAFLQFGMQVKVEGVASCLEQVEWCQSRPIEYEVGKHKFVRDPAKVLSCALGGTKYTEPGARPRLVNTIGMAELVLNLGVPVLQEYAIALMRNSGTKQHLVLDEVDPMYFRVFRELRAFGLRHLQRIDPRPVTTEARLSFAAAFGWSVELQIEIEEFLKGWSFNLSGDDILTEDIDVSSWLPNYTSVTGQDVYPWRE